MVFFNTTFRIIKERDQMQFYKAVRMGPSYYDVLLNLTEHKLRKFSERVPINPECSLAVTLMYLAHGAPIAILSWAFKMGVSTVREIILETCDVLWNELSAVYISPPNEHEWETIANSFYNSFGMPNCVGAIDGKHINITCPPNAGSEYFNYKGYHSIVLLAACDANLIFTLVDIGAYGSQSDGGIFANSAFGKMIINGNLPIPKWKPLPGSTLSFPHYFIGDSAFPLKTNLMRSYSNTRLSPEERNFNDRLSKARRVIENAFGVLCTKWRILLKSINAYPNNVDKIVKAVVLLHNYCKLNDINYCPSDYTDHYVDGQLVEGLWRHEPNTNVLHSFRDSNNRNATRNAFELRDRLKNYFNM